MLLTVLFSDQPGVVNKNHTHSFVLCSIVIHHKFYIPSWTFKKKSSLLRDCMDSGDSVWNHATFAENASALRGLYMLMPKRCKDRGSESIKAAALFFSPFLAQ